MADKKEPLADDSSLEQPTSVPIEDNDSEALEKGSAQPAKTSQSTQPVGPKLNWREKIFKRLSGVNPYLVMFILVVVLGVIITFIVNRVNETNDPASLTFQGSELDQQSIDDLLKAEQNIGTVEQTLTVAANAIFNGKILVKSDLDVAGSIRVGGPLNLPGITVAGTSDFDEVNVNNNLSILGSASIQQSLTVQGGANISGNVSVGGTISAGKISTEAMEFTGDLSLTKHIDTGGSVPRITSGTAVGSGGTVSISGNDIAGTVTANTGGVPPAGIMARVSFTRPYNSTPYVQVTPIGSASSTINYYVERDSSGFRIGTTSAPSGSTTYKFDYFIVE